MTSFIPWPSKLVGGAPSSCSNFGSPHTTSLPFPFRRVAARIPPTAFRRMIVLHPVLKDLYVSVPSCSKVLPLFANTLKEPTKYEDMCFIVLMIDPLVDVIPMCDTWWYMAQTCEVSSLLAALPELNDSTWFFKQLMMLVGSKLDQYLARLPQFNGPDGTNNGRPHVTPSPPLDAGSASTAAVPQPQEPLSVDQVLRTGKHGRRKKLGVLQRITFKKRKQSKSKSERKKMLVRYFLEGRHAFGGSKRLCFTLDAARLGKLTRMLMAIGRPNNISMWAPPQDVGNFGINIGHGKIYVWKIIAIWCMELLLSLNYFSVFLWMNYMRFGIQRTGYAKSF